LAARGALAVVVDQLQWALTLVAALGCAVIGGVFFAFSTFVMKALARLPAREGIAAMQSINVVVLNPWFLGAFLGTAAVCVLAMIFSLARWQDASTVYLVVGSLLYLVGTLFVTIAFNVPRNEGLAAVAAAHPDSARQWTGYVASWTAWNHVRTVAALAAAAAFGIALARGGWYP
jgi:uncharacterized membrane protein